MTTIIEKNLSLFEKNDTNRKQELIKVASYALGTLAASYAASGKHAVLVPFEETLTLTYSRSYANPDDREGVVRESLVSEEATVADIFSLDDTDIRSILEWLAEGIGIHNIMILSDSVSDIVSEGVVSDGNLKGIATSGVLSLAW